MSTSKITTSIIMIAIAITTACRPAEPAHETVSTFSPSLLATDLRPEPSLTIVIGLGGPEVVRGSRRDLSCYGYPGDRQGRRTANGERFDPDALTCATSYRRLRSGKIVDDFPMGSLIRLPRGTVVRVNDRVPNQWRRRIDLTPAAYKAEDGPMPWGLIRGAYCEVLATQ